MRRKQKKLKPWQMQKLTTDRKVLFEVAWEMAEDPKMLRWAGVWLWLYSLTYSQKKQYLRLIGVIKK